MNVSRRPRPPRFLGLDLAWAPRHSSGGAVMELHEDGLKLVSSCSLRAHEDILSWIARNRGRDGVTLAVNAPIIVDNMPDNAPATPSPRALLAASGRRVPGQPRECLAPTDHRRALMRMSFDPDPSAEEIAWSRPNRRLRSCSRCRASSPTQGPCRRAQGCRDPLPENIDAMLTDAYPSMIDSAALDELIEADLPSCNGSRVGELEERLEAVLCAYTAAYLNIRGPEDCAFLGDLERGYVLLPTTRSAPAEA